MKLTREQIEKASDEELDCMIAEHVMGTPFMKPTHGTCCTCQTCGHDHDNCQCYYSTDISAAWQVVEKFKHNSPFDNHVTFAGLLAEMCDADQDDYIADAYNLISGISPKLICRAALMAVCE